jgi:hypothetical protein
VATRIDLLDAAPEHGGGTLLRALRADASYAFVLLTDKDGPYEVVREGGDVDGAGGVVRVEPREADHDDHDRFDGQRGYLGTRLYRRADDGRPRFVEVTRWSSPLMVQRADALAGAALYTVVPR